jgi:hypothetical protein
MAIFDIDRLASIAIAPHYGLQAYRVQSVPRLTRADAENIANHDKKEEIKLEVRMRVLTEKLDGIEKAAAVFPATSAIGAMFHLCLIKEAADLIASWVPEDSEGARECDKARKALNRMCYSIRDFIVARTGVNPGAAIIS